MVSRATDSKSKVFSIAASGGFTNSSTSNSNPASFGAAAFFFAGDFFSGGFAMCSSLMVVGSTTPIVKDGFSNLSMMSLGWMGSNNAVASLPALS
eukprot:CAMPEP_0115620022 /NCGR_PEP_ID=MMETSP0272-20121206/24981_1 /TAXON_ID=71861 /ORGANISM="Scrippsiella trochoidea, Strain CCMP3099" /LENGTH=94 /DNA_ID=CAMNT_0003056067 /DNA_START=102 /DNA_END=386 /DNA_ORIENTATION=+